MVQTLLFPIPMLPIRPGTYRGAKNLIKKEDAYRQSLEAMILLLRIGQLLL